MKNITEKKSDEILKRITANEIIALKHIDNEEAFAYFVGNNADIAYEIGGHKGVNKVLNTVKKYRGVKK